jgi:hypothetical protein
MLNRWVEESETNPNLMVSKKDEEVAKSENADKKVHASAGRNFKSCFFLNI